MTRATYRIVSSIIKMNRLAQKGALIHICEVRLRTQPFAVGPRGVRLMAVSALATVCYEEGSVQEMVNSLEALRGGVVVSVQASEGEPLDRPEILCALAESALSGGACAVRMAQPNNMEYFKRQHQKFKRRQPHHRPLCGNLGGHDGPASVDV